MNPLSSQKKYFLPVIWTYLAISILCSACLPHHVPVTGSLKAEPTRQNALTQYGFQASGFTPAQEKTIEKTLAAYAQALGGAEKLRQIILTFNHGEIRTITYDPEKIGASSKIVLGPTVFSMELATAANLSCYGAKTEESHSMVVIGHEISHLLILASERQTGVNWSENYRQRVGRNWVTLKDPQAPEEEAVTEFALKVLKRGYYYSLNQDTRETSTEIIYEINTWAADFLSALKGLD